MKIMLAQKGNILLSLISTVAFVAILAAGYFLLQNQQSQDQSKSQYSNSTPIPSPTTQNETVNWKTYINSKYGFSFKYPANWSARDIFPDGVLCNDHNTPGSTGIKGSICYILDVRSQNNQGLTIFYGTKQENATFELFPSGTHQILLESKAITLGTKEIKRDIFGWDQTVKTEIHTSKDAFFATYNSNNPIWFDNLGFQIDFSNFEEAGIIDKNNVYIADQILSTFKFTKATEENGAVGKPAPKATLLPTADWQTISAKTFSIKAPGNLVPFVDPYAIVVRQQKEYIAEKPQFSTTQVGISDMGDQDNIFVGGSRRQWYLDERCTPYKSEPCPYTFREKLFGNHNGLEVYQPLKKSEEAEAKQTRIAILVAIGPKLFLFNGSPEYSQIIDTAISTLKLN